MVHDNVRVEIWTKIIFTVPNLLIQFSKKKPLCNTLIVVILVFLRDVVTEMKT